MDYISDSLLSKMHLLQNLKRLFNCFLVHGMAIVICNAIGGLQFGCPRSTFLLPSAAGPEAEMRRCVLVEGPAVLVELVLSLRPI